MSKLSFTVTEQSLEKQKRFYAGGKELKLGDTVYFGFVMNTANIYGNQVTKLDPDKDQISMSMHEFVLDQETGFLYQLYSKD